MSLKDDLLLAARADAIPEGSAGRWHVKKLKLSGPVDAPRGEGKFETIPPGQYTSLFCYTNSTLHQLGELVMHDCPAELRKHLQFMLSARGRVLVTGLGLGCVARGLLANPAVTELTVIEKSPAVLKLVAPYMPRHLRFQIIQADALEWVKVCGMAFDCAWHDIWTDTDAGEMHLARAHGQLIGALAKRTKFQGAWAFPREFRRAYAKFNVI